MGLLDGKVAIVTGAGGGLGREHALALSAEGASIVVNDLGGARDGTGGSQSMADTVVEEIRAAGGEAVANYDSVATVEGGESILETALGAFQQVDVLVNNAGILRDKSLSNMDESMWDIVNQVHLRGTYCVTRPVFNHMKARGEGGVIISTSSGIWGFHNCLWQEGKKHNIRSFVLAPVALTRLTDDLPGFQAEELQERMKPGLVSPLVTYLASDLAKEYTGKTFFVGGGRIAEMKMVRGEGATKKEDGGLWTPKEIAGRIEEILVS
jgi:NAD(P)-dependent dehydrogenase (short-subunit alcohol dehydrogenase family)